MLNYKYSLEDLNEMLPWERDIYVFMVEQHVKEQNEQIKQASGGGYGVTRQIEYPE